MRGQPCFVVVAAPSFLPASEPFTHFDQVSATGEIQARHFQAAFPDLERHCPVHLRSGISPTLPCFCTMGDQRCSSPTVQVFEEMPTKNGVLPDNFIYTAVVRCFCEMKDLHRAWDLIFQMESRGFATSSLTTYNVLIHGLCKNKRVMEALQVKNSFHGKGLHANEVTYCTLLLGLCNSRKLSIALELLKEMIALGFVPTEAAYSLVVDELRKEGKVQEAVDLVEMLGKMRIFPSLFTYNALINSLYKHQKFKEAESLFREMIVESLMKCHETCIFH